MMLKQTVWSIPYPWVPSFTPTVRRDGRVAGNKGFLSSHGVPALGGGWGDTLRIGETFFTSSCDCMLKIPSSECDYERFDFYFLDNEELIKKNLESALPYAMLKSLSYIRTLPTLELHDL